MKKYRFAFPKSTYVIFALIAAAAVVAIVFASLRLAGAAGYEPLYPATDVVSIVAFSAFLVLVGWDLFGSYYAFGGESFVVAQLFSKKRIPRDLLCKLVIDEPSGLAVLYYADSVTPDALLYVVLRVGKKKIAPLAEDLRAFKSDLPVEYNLPPEEGGAGQD